MSFVPLRNNWWLYSSPHQTVWNKQIKSWFHPPWQFHTHIDKYFFYLMCVLWPWSVLYLALLKLCKFTCNEKCFLRSVGACLSVCVCTVGCILSCAAVLDDRDFQLSRVRRQTQGGYKTDSRHSACLSVAKIQGIFITVQNCVVLWNSFGWSINLIFVSEACLAQNIQYANMQIQKLGFMQGWILKYVLNIDKIHM